MEKFDGVKIKAHNRAINNKIESNLIKRIKEGKKEG